MSCTAFFCARTFETTQNGMPGTVKAVGVQLGDGKNTLYAEAYRDRADAIEKLGLKKGDLVQVQLSTSVRSREKDGVKFYSNNISIDACLLVVKASF